MRQRPVRLRRASAWGPFATRVRRNSWLRSPGTVGYRAAARTVIVGPPPKVLANSVPKAGTHLLTTLLAGVPRLWYSGLHTIDKDYRSDLDVPGDGLGDFDAAAFRKRMRTIRNGQYVTAHLGWLPGMAEVLDELGFRRLLMIRDPRDIAVSLAFYNATNRRLHTYDRFANRMSTVDERILAAITGLPAENGNPPFPSIAQRLGKYQPWLDDGATCVVRFEDLVGVNGGGSEEAQLDAVRRVLRHCRRTADDDAVRALARSTFAQHSATFRRGAIGDWQNHFTPELTAAFDATAPTAVADFGYR